ncbi:RagB/SusD family nutrient uptake outer membrane protein [Ekhidna sp. MALMAid0563]|uniref:RagB/SusD family nutrient uptake outer membrane protein n=1 Tax=Ekhidna sp. MALMAid0563 TaxID=3143937 RepID=UPI0032DEF9C2
MKHIKYFLFAIAVVFITSCDDEFLNPLPDTVVALDSYFATDSDVLSGVIGIYDALQGVNESTETNIGRANRGVQFEHLLTEHRTDNTRNATLEGSKSDFHRYIVEAVNVESEDYYQSMYEVIFRANNILNYIDVADESNQASYAAEAKFLRAYAYFKLVRLYGDVPLVTAPVNPGEEGALFTRIPEAQVYEQIILDLQEAVSVLDNSNKSRASKAAAQGILAKVYLSLETPEYALAEALCEDIIATGNYRLMPDFNDVFYSELNDEIIFAIQYQAGNAEESQGFSAEFTSSTRAGRDDGQNIVNANLKADFDAFGGSRTPVSITDLNGVLDDTENEVAKFLPEGSDITTTPPSYGVGRNAGNDYIALRYADVLLMHVEATMAGGPATVDAAAIASFQEVRDRAGLTTPVASVTKEDLMVERRVELAFENQRYFDLIRFGELDNVLSAHSDEMGYVYDARKARYLPIPQREINLSGGLLTQNLGY